VIARVLESAAGTGLALVVYRLIRVAAAAVAWRLIDRRIHGGTK
jgi:hypothetical protein